MTMHPESTSLAYSAESDCCRLLQIVEEVVDAKKYQALERAEYVIVLPDQFKCCPFITHRNADGRAKREQGLSKDPLTAFCLLRDASVICGAVMVSSRQQNSSGWPRSSSL